MKFKIVGTVPKQVRPKCYTVNNEWYVNLSNATELVLFLSDMDKNVDLSRKETDDYTTIEILN